MASAAAKKELAKQLEDQAAAIVHDRVSKRGPRKAKARGGVLRTITLVDKRGEPVKVATHAEVLQELLNREGVEAACEGKRPKVIACLDCKIPVRVRSGKTPSRCRPCALLRQYQKYRERHADSERERQRKKYWENVEAERAANAERGRAAYAADPEKIRARNRERYQKNKERIQAAHRAYRAKKKAEKAAQQKEGSQ